MRVCAKADCTCTIAPCYSMEVNDHKVIFKNIDTSSMKTLDIEEAKRLIKKRRLNIEGNRFSDKAYKKLERFIENNNP